MTNEILRVSTIHSGEEPIKINVNGISHELPPGSGREFSLQEN
jgi:hypothetical protein